MSNITKIRLVGAKLFHADGQTDVTKSIVVFRNFANAPTNSLFKCVTPIWHKSDEFIAKRSSSIRLAQAGSWRPEI